MAQQREITELGNPVLRQEAESVESISDTEIQELIDDMILTAAEAKRRRNRRSSGIRVSSHFHNRGNRESTLPRRPGN